MIRECNWYLKMQVLFQPEVLGQTVAASGQPESAGQPWPPWFSLGWCPSNNPSLQLCIWLPCFLQSHASLGREPCLRNSSVHISHKEMTNSPTCYIMRKKKQDNSGASFVSPQILPWTVKSHVCPYNSALTLWTNFSFHSGNVCLFNSPLTSSWLTGLLPLPEMYVGLQEL